MTKRLGLKPSQLAVAFRHIRPNWKNYLDYLEVAATDGNEDARKLLTAYCGLTRRDQQYCMPEQLCELTGVKPEELFGVVCEQLWKSSRMEANLITAIAFPRVIERTARAAQTVGGIKDREMFHKHSGFLPTPAGPSINLDLRQHTVAPTDAPKALPSMEDDALLMESAITVPLLQGHVPPDNSNR